MPKVLITGVAGMIGSHLLDELMERGYVVSGIDNLSFGKIGDMGIGIYDRARNSLT